MLRTMKKLMVKERRGFWFEVCRDDKARKGLLRRKTFYPFPRLVTISSQAY